MHAGEEAYVAARGGEVPDGLLYRVEVSMASHPVAHRERAADGLVRERLEDVPAVFDLLVLEAYAPDAVPVQDGQRHAVVVDALRRLVVDEGLGVGDSPGPHLEGPVVARLVVRRPGRLELEDDPVPQFLP